jgi:biotin carboxyl carrier protein
MYTASIKEQKFEIDFEGQTTLNGDNVIHNLSRTADGAYVLTMNGVKTIADLVRIDKDNKIVVLRIAGSKYQIQLKEPIDILLEKLGMKNMGAKKMNNLKAPMPGLITKIMVKEGDEIKQGEPLLILEAMKMENVFKAAADVKIKSIKIAEKQAVEKGAELITFE